MTETQPKFIISSGLKNLIGKDLITNELVAIFEIVKNSYDADAKNVWVIIENDKIIIADNGKGMSFDDLQYKWLKVGYSDKTKYAKSNNTNRVMAGNKGIGRFSADRLGSLLTIQTRVNKGEINQLSINWDKFDTNPEKTTFQEIPVEHAVVERFRDIDNHISHSLEQGTILIIEKLHTDFDNEKLNKLKKQLEKLINPLKPQDFHIRLICPGHQMNIEIENTIFAKIASISTKYILQYKDNKVIVQLEDRGKLIYKIDYIPIQDGKFELKYKNLSGLEINASVFYLNRAAKSAFYKLTNQHSVEYGSIFLFKNNIQVSPIGEKDVDYFGIDRRHAQGYNRYLGNRDLIGVINIDDNNNILREATSRNQGFVENEASQELIIFVMEEIIKPFEKYIVPVLWSGNNSNEDLTSNSLQNEKASLSILDLLKKLHKDNVNILEYDDTLYNYIDVNSKDFEGNIEKLSDIAIKLKNPEFINAIEKAKEQYEFLQHQKRESDLKIKQEIAKREEVEKQVEIGKRNIFNLNRHYKLDKVNVVAIVDQIRFYSVEITKKVEFIFKFDTDKEKTKRIIGDIGLFSNKLMALTRYAYISEYKEEDILNYDLCEFIKILLNESKFIFNNMDVEIQIINKNNLVFNTKFNKTDFTLLWECLLSNAEKNGAKKFVVEFISIKDNTLKIHVWDDGLGLDKNILNPVDIFNLGFSMSNTTKGSGLGLYYAKKVLKSKNNSNIAFIGKKNLNNGNLEFKLEMEIINEIKVHNTGD